MATIKTTLAINATSVFPQDVSFTVSHTYSNTDLNTDANEIGQLTVSNANTELTVGDLVDSRALVYIKNTGASGDPDVVMIDGAGSVEFATIKPGEFMVFPYDSGDASNLFVKSSSSSVAYLDYMVAELAA